MGHVDHGKTTLTAAITKVLAERGTGHVRAVRPHRPGAGGGGPRHHHQPRPRRVRDGDPALRARRHARSRRLREEHDHGRGPDGRGHPGRIGGGRRRSTRPPSTSCSRARWASSTSWSRSTRPTSRTRSWPTSSCSRCATCCRPARLRRRRRARRARSPASRRLRASSGGTEGDRRAAGRGGRLRAGARALCGAPFLMPVENVLTITGRGTVVTGAVERGRCGSGDGVDVILGAAVRSVVTGVETFGKTMERAKRATTWRCCSAVPPPPGRCCRGGNARQPDRPEVRGQVYLLSAAEGRPSRPSPPATARSSTCAPRTWPATWTSGRTRRRAAR